MIIDPATANELISTPSRFKIISPTNKNTIIITTDTIEAFSDSITLYFSLSKMIKGILPITSIIANKIIVDEINSFKEIDKTPGKDKKQGKRTLLSVLGEKKAISFCENLT